MFRVWYLLFINSFDMLRLPTLLKSENRKWFMRQTKRVAAKMNESKANELNGIFQKHYKSEQNKRYFQP